MFCWAVSPKPQLALTESHRGSYSLPHSGPLWRQSSSLPPSPLPSATPCSIWALREPNRPHTCLLNPSLPWGSGLALAQGLLCQMPVPGNWHALSFNSQVAPKLSPPFYEEEAETQRVETASCCISCSSLPSGLTNTQGSPPWYTFLSPIHNLFQCPVAELTQHRGWSATSIARIPCIRISHTLSWLTHWAFISSS